MSPPAFRVMVSLAAPGQVRQSPASVTPIQTTSGVRIPAYPPNGRASGYRWRDDAIDDALISSNEATSGTNRLAARTRRVSPSQSVGAWKASIISIAAGKEVGRWSRNSSECLEQVGHRVPGFDNLNATVRKQLTTSPRGRKPFREWRASNRQKTSTLRW